MNKYNILIVEDEPVWQKILKRYFKTALKQMGGQNYIQIVDNFESAWDMLGFDMNWNLLCTDIKLRKSGSKNEGAKLVNLAQEKGIPTVIVSGTVSVTNKEVRDFLKKNKVEDFISKEEFDDKEFVAIIKRLLNDTNSQTPIKRRIFICWTKPLSRQKKTTFTFKL